mgnify:CR=1 FL=1
MTNATIEGTRRVDPPEEREDDRHPVAQVEGALSRLIEKTEAEYRSLQVQMAANRRTWLKLTNARAALGVQEVGE